MFMDDFLAGVADGNEAIGIYYELTALMKTIKLPVAKRGHQLRGTEGNLEAGWSRDSKDDSSLRRGLEC
jgi:hypothetical protein